MKGGVGRHPLHPLREPPLLLICFIQRQLVPEYTPFPVEERAGEGGEEEEDLGFGAADEEGEGADGGDDEVVGEGACEGDGIGNCFSFAFGIGSQSDLVLDSTFLMKLKEYVYTKKNTKKRD